MENVNKELLEQALTYSKSELQQADSKLGAVLTANGLFVAAYVTGFVETLIRYDDALHNKILVYVFATLLVASLIGAMYAISGLWAKFVPANSLFYFKHFNDKKFKFGNDEDMNNLLNDFSKSDEESHKQMATTIIVNSKLSENKYRKANIAMMLMFIPFTSILLFKLF